MKSNLEKYVQEVISGFQLHKGRASVYCFPPISFAEAIISVLNQFYERSPGAQVFIVVDGYKTRQNILDRVSKEEGHQYNLKVLSADYVNTKYRYDYRLIITVGINENLELIQFLSNQGKFVLTILTKNIMDSNFINNIRSILPEIKVTISNNAVRSDSIYSPVEEYRVSVDLSNDDTKLYNKCSEYIATSVSIFGDISNIEKCKIGDPNLNISASEYREMLAKENGWSNTLDTSIEWSKQIDDVYNPNMLFERANNFYNIVKQRRDLVTDNVNKLVEIYKICNENSGKRILIVSKRGEFASIVTKFINEVGTFECLDYHDNIESTHGFDSNGNTILIKSGKDKGKPRVFGSTALSNINLRKFNDISLFNDTSDGSTTICMSIKNSSDVKLETAIDLVIFTSPLVNDFIAFKTRFTNVTFNSVPNKLYKVYCSNTIEHKHLTNQKESSLITIIDNNDNFIGYDETNDDVSLY